MSASAIRTLGFSGLIAAALIVSLTAFSGRETTPADAADAETAALIGYFNQHRASIGVPLLATSSSMNAATQQSAQNAIATCSHAILPSGSGTKWGGYGFSTAAQIWSAYQQDSFIMGIIGRASFRSAGVGRAVGPNCNLSPYWVMWLSTSGVDDSPPTAPASATPTKSPTPTASPPATPTAPPTGQATATPTPPPTGQVTATPTQPSTVTPTPLPTPIPSSTASPSPSPTPAPPLRKGDTDCNGAIDDWDLLTVLMVSAELAADADCMEPTGFDCTDGVGVPDILALVHYLGGLPRNLPDGCPDLGSTITPTPSPTPSPTPVATPTPTPTDVPDPTPSPTDGLPLSIDHCFLAPIAYEIENWLTLEGPTTCGPEGETSYTCDFQTPGNQAVCTSASPDTPSYYCNVWGSSVPPFALCESLADTPDYGCYAFETGVECLPHQPGLPVYLCAVTGEVACSTDASGYPDFHCVRVVAAFVCALP